MKKIVFALLIMFALVFVSDVYALDWTQYESGRNNIRLDGYQGQPGYVSFTDGNGTVLGYLWMSSGSGLVWASNNDGVGLGETGTGAINVKTTKITDAIGMPVSATWSGNIVDNVP